MGVSRVHRHTEEYLAFGLSMNGEANLTFLRFSEIYDIKYQ